MANPILTSEILQDDNLDALIAKIKQLEDVISKLNEELKKYEKEAAQMAEAMRETTHATTEGREEMEKQAKKADELGKIHQRLAEAANNENKALLEMREELKKANRLRQLEAKLNTTVEGSYENLSAQMSILKTRYKQLTREQQLNTEEGKALTNRIKEIQDTLKAMDEDVGVHVRNVGNYRDALGGLPGVFGAAGRGANAFSEQLKAMLANPVVLTLGLISGALMVLYDAFKRSETGVKVMIVATGVLDASLNMISRVLDVIVGAIIRFAEDPLASIKALGESIKQNLTNRFIGLVASIGFAGEALMNLVKGDFEAAKQSVKDLGAALTQMGTGLDAKQRKEVASWFGGLIKTMQETTNESIELRQARLSIAAANRELVRSIEAVTTAEQLQSAVAADSTKGFKERQEAAEAAMKSTEKRLRLEAQVAKNNLTLVNREIDLRRAAGQDWEDLADKQLGAYQQLVSAERDLTLAIRDNEKERAEIRQAELASTLGILQDGFSSAYAANSKFISDQKNSFSERVAMLEDSVKLAKSSFEKQIEEIQKFTGVQIAANDLINESDAVVLNQKIRNLGLSEQIEQELLMSIKERRAAILELMDAEKGLREEREKMNKAQAVEIFNYGKAAEAATLKRAQEIAGKAAEAAQDEAKRRAKKGDFSIYSLLGLDRPEGIDQAMSQALNSISGFINEFVQQIQRAADERVKASERMVAAAENEYNRQIELQLAGEANRAESARRELEEAKRNQQKALENQRKAAQASRRLATIEQATNLVTASANIWKTFTQTSPAPLGIALALGAIGTMWGSFAAAKIKAAQLAREEFSEGDFTILEGGRHGSGRDIYIGTQGGKAQYAEGGEARMILPRKSTRKYRGVLPDIFQALKTGTFEQEFARQGQAAASVPLVVGTGSNISTTGIEKGIGRLIEQGREKTYTNSAGQLVVQRGNRTTIYVN